MATTLARNDPALVLIAERCKRQVIKHAGHVGLTHSDFMARVPEYRQLGNLRTQIEALTALAEMRGIASSLTQRGVWYFFIARFAPECALHGWKDQ